ncbi:uncharacterized protein LOC123670769 isoform X3 [Harmonia axyridis]|uniref:uncharacterized protein LOC123670769 isoform X3 n=1 Tax=Harmonia axyridis TaxID=115357 RepID=UPI001E276C9E|nr:uncharacterized protein LOC123670769 isoform X3 [Harmonia axyridis]
MCAMDPLSEVKTMLRSILISSPVVIDVYQLNRDFREQEGTGIPYQKFGHKSLIDFLKSIPDVLFINGNSEYSEVTPVESEKSSHVNDLVLKQKSKKTPGSFFPKNCKPSRNRRNKLNSFQPPPRFQKHQEVISKVKVDDGYSSQKSYSDKSTNALKPSTNQKTSLECNKNSNRVGNRPTNYNSSSDNSREIRQRLNSGNKEIEGFSKNNCNKNIKNPKIVEESTKLLRRINYKDTFLNEDNSFNVDISLKGEKPADKIYWNGGTIKKTNKKNNTPENCSGTENSLEKNIKSSTNKCTRSRHFTPNSSSHLMDSAVKNKSKETHNREKYKSLSLTTKKNCIPKAVQDNLKNLIADFPEGICCSELPLVYKNFTGEDLLFEDFGYRCLIYLCLDLEHIFHCTKESQCDYKLFDVRKPLPELNIPQESSLEGMTQNSESSPAIPEMRWGSFDSFVPHDAVRLGFKPNRIQVAEVLEEGTSINVTVADIYDISKFWMIIDDSQLDELMDNMQEFYGINRTRYLVPKSLLVETLYCVVLFKGKFHRAVILNVMPGYEYLKVYYVDFGTLAKVSKTEVWYITKEFSELPTQAIRARLGDIYPPNQGTTWSPFANYDFSGLTCMKKFIAEIIRVDKKKNLVDIKLNDGYSDMSDILVNRNLAKFINKPQKKHIDDPNCKPRVQYVHLFPTFDEIENWIVPSTEEAADFLNTTVTADFLYSQYFNRTVDTNLIKSIEEKMELTCKKNKSLMKYHKSSEISLNHNIEEINKIAYGDLYNFFTENVIEDNHINESETKELEEIQDDVLGENAIEESECKGTVEDHNVSFTNKRIIDIKNDELLISILRQTRMKKSYSVQDDKCGKNFNTSEKVLKGTESESFTLHTKRIFEELSESSNGIDISCKSYNTSNLMQFDDDNVSVPEVSSTFHEQVCAMSTKPFFKVVDCSESSDADDEDSDAVQNSLDYSYNSNKSKELKKVNSNNELNGIITINTTSLQETRIFVDQDNFATHNVDATQNESKNGCLTHASSDGQNIDVERLIILNSYSSNSEDQSSHKDFSGIVDCCSNASDANFEHCDFNNSIVQEKQIQTLMTENLHYISRNRYPEYQLDIFDSVNASSIFVDEGSQKDPTLEDVQEHNFATSNISNSAAAGNAINDNHLISNFHHRVISYGDTISNDFQLLKLKGEAISSISRLGINNSSTPIYSQSLFDTSIVTIDSAECESEFREESISRLSSKLETLEDEKKISENSAIMSPVQDLSFENNHDCQAFSSITNSVVASTPLPNQRALSKDRSFLEEFEILDHSTSSSISDLRNETVLSRLSFISGEWISIELQNSKCGTNNSDPLNDAQSTEPDNSVKNEVLNSVSQENTLLSAVSMSLESSSQSKIDSNTSLLSESEFAVKKDVSKDLENADKSVNPTNWKYESASIPQSQVGNLEHDFNYRVPFNNPEPSTSSHPRMLAPVCGIQTWMHPPRMLVPGPPLPFIPIPTSGQQRLLFPSGPQFHVPVNHYNCVPGSQQAIINGVAQNYGTCPIVIFNYNFLPPMNQNSK